MEDGIGRREVGLQRTRGKPAVSFYVQLPLQRLEAALGDAYGITASRLPGFLGPLRLTAGRARRERSAAR